MRFPPGGLDQGLIDFPTFFEGRWVFICWQRGEPEVRFWHELDGGYAGRREIQAEQIIGMGQMDDEHWGSDGLRLSTARRHPPPWLQPGPMP